jgi:hypothetical protein
MNRGVAGESKWIHFLRDNKYLDQVRDLLRKAGAEYRAIHGVKPKYRSAAMKRMEKIKRAIEAVGHPRLPELLQLEFGTKFNPAYIKDAVDALKKELQHLEEIVNYKGGPAPQQLSLPVQEQPGKVAKTGQNYGLREDLGYGYFY